MAFETKIIGADFDTNCDCCGRNLKVGVKLSGLGTFGADCIRKSVVYDRKRYSQGRPDASWLRIFAKIAERDTPERISDMGYTRAMFLNVEIEKLEKVGA